MKYNLSIDIDKDKITLIRAAPADKDNPLSLEYSAIWPIPPDDDGISKVIKAVLKDHNIREKEVVVVASASARNKDTFVGKLYLPVIPLSEIRSAVMWEARAIMPFDPKGAIFNYHVEGRARDRYSVEKIAVFFGAIKVKEARRLTSIITKAGLIPLKLLHPFSAIAFFLKENALIGTIALLDAGSTVSLLIYKEGQFEFERKIDSGEDELDRALTEAGVNEVELSTLKNEYGLLSFEDLSRLSLSEPPLGSEKIRIFADELAIKVRRALRQWIEEQGEEVVEKIYLIGSLARLRNLAPYLTSKLKIDVVVGDADSLGIELSHPVEMAVPDLPLLIPALGGSSNERAKIELLPQEAKLHRKLTRVKVGIKIALSLIIGVTLLLSFVTHIHFLALRRVVDAQRAEIATLKAGERRDIPLKGKKEELRRELTRYHSIAGDVRPIWASSLREITNIIPAGVLLRKMRLDGEAEALFIDGVVVQKEKGIPPEVVLARFVEEIEGSPFFAGVSLTSIDNYIGEDAGGMPARSFSLHISARRLPPEAFTPDEGVME
jgi:Tfp pilus assembly PilM family ATPase